MNKTAIVNQRVPDGVAVRLAWLSRRTLLSKSSILQLMILGTTPDAILKEAGRRREDDEEEPTNE